MVWTGMHVLDCLCLLYRAIASHWLATHTCSCGGWDTAMVRQLPTCTQIQGMMIQTLKVASSTSTCSGIMGSLWATWRWVLHIDFTLSDLLIFYKVKWDDRIAKMMITKLYNIHFQVYVLQVWILIVSWWPLMWLQKNNHLSVASKTNCLFI